MAASSNVSNHPRIELLENHITYKDMQYNNLNIHMQSESEFEELDRILYISENDDDGDKKYYFDRIANVKDNYYNFPNKKKRKVIKYKNITNILKSVYFRILGEKKNFKFRKIFVKSKNIDIYERYILKNPSVEEIFSRFNASDRISKKISKKNFILNFKG